MTRPVLHVTLVGTSPLLMHSGSLLDPLDPVSAELATYHGKAAKSAADHAHIGDLEFIGSLWRDGDRPCVPARTLEAALREAADRRGLGRRLRQGVFVEGDAPLSFDGPREVDALRRDPAFRLRTGVTVDGERRVFTRPFFRRWAADVGIAYDAAHVTREALVDLVTLVGDDIGIGAGRPRYGRFAAVVAAFAPS